MAPVPTVTKCASWIGLDVLAGTADSRDVTEALAWAKTNRDTLRRLWREYSE
jgi:hypothetical protein